MLIGKRNLYRLLLSAEIAECQARHSASALDFFNEKGRSAVYARPSKFYRNIRHAAIDKLVIAVIYDTSAITEQRCFLTTLILYWQETAAVGSSYICKNSNFRPDYILEPRHLAGHWYSCLKDSELRSLVQFPDRKRDTNLRIIASRTACYDYIVLKQTVEPLFDYRLSTAAGNSDDRHIETIAMISGKSV